MRKMSVRQQVYVARIGYFLSGFAVACWAPLIPILQHNLQLSTEAVSIMVVTFGVGAVVGMLLSGPIMRYFGFKITYASCCLLISTTICIIAWMPSYEIVLGALVLFGISLGCIDVAINVFAAYLEKRYRLLLMSVLYAYYSMGEVIGAILMMFLLTIAMSPSLAILMLISMIYIASAYYTPVIINIKPENKQDNRSFVMPVQPVISLALIIAFTYVVGGAILDWSSLYLTIEAGVPLNYATIGYGIVSACMLVLRIWSRPIINVIGTFNFAFFGALIMIAGLVAMVLFPNIIVIIISFFAIGIGMSNISPLVTSATGKQDKMPLVPAISFLSVCGYTGLLLGPAALGGIASFISLGGIFLFLAALTAVSAVLIYTVRRELNAIDPRLNSNVD